MYARCSCVIDPSASRRTSIASNWPTSPMSLSSDFLASYVTTASIGPGHGQPFVYVDRVKHGIFAFHFTPVYSCVQCRAHETDCF